MPLNRFSSLKHFFSGLKPADVAIIVASALAFVLSAMAIYSGPAPASLVVSSGNDEWIYPLVEERTIEVQGPIGITKVQIKDGQARIISSPCINQICVASPAVAHKGDWSACLPNGIFIRAEGDYEDSDVDAVVR
ncbi:MAG: NusG domain II-containing protein [Spirochaetota bacterium]